MLFKSSKRFSPGLNIILKTVSFIRNQTVLSKGKMDGRFLYTVSGNPYGSVACISCRRYCPEYANLVTKLGVYTAV